MQIWRKPSQPKVINPKEEANKIAHDFATRADHQSLPEEVKSALEKQQPSTRLHSIYLTKSEHAGTDTSFTPHELETVLSTQKISDHGKDQIIYIFYSKSPPSFKARLP